jgi:hypothetical protein
MPTAAHSAGSATAERRETRIRAADCWSGSRSPRTSQSTHRVAADDARLHGERRAG